MEGLDQRTLEIIADCWVKFRRTQIVRELDQPCRHIICTFLLKIAQDDPTWKDDPEIREDIGACMREPG